jgi:hypothetical protein
MACRSIMGGEGKYLDSLWRSIPVNISSHCWGLEVLLHLFWSSALDGYEWSTPRLTPFICGCVSPRVELVALKRIISCSCRDSKGVSLVFQPADWSLYWQTYCDTLYCSGYWLNQEWEKLLMANPWALYFFIFWEEGGFPLVSFTSLVSFAPAFHSFILSVL